MPDHIAEVAKVSELEPDHHTVHTEILIYAPAQIVWQVLTDFTAMPSWSPSFKGINGQFSDGANVTTTFDMGDGDEEYAATLSVEDGTSFGWSEDYDGIRDDHVYRVEATSAAQTRFIQTDAFKGTADWSTTQELAEMYRGQYAEFNRALKREVERQTAR